MVWPVNKFGRLQEITSKFSIHQKELLANPYNNLRENPDCSGNVMVFARVNSCQLGAGILL